MELKSAVEIMRIVEGIANSPEKSKGVNWTAQDITEAQETMLTFCESVLKLQNELAEAL